MKWAGRWALGRLRCGWCLWPLLAHTTVCKHFSLILENLQHIIDAEIFELQFLECWPHCTEIHDVEM